jgi:hypothetical protein
VHSRLFEQIASLATLNKAQLLAIWAQNFSKDPPLNHRKEMMVSVLAYRIQEREFATGNGYLYRGESYSSLSMIAWEITGTRWPGPLFFGVRKP